MENGRKFGCFALSKDFLDNYSEKKKGKIFSKVTIYRAELFHFKNMVVYEGTSNYFKTIEIGEDVPWYRVVFQGEDVIFVEGTSPIYYYQIPSGYGKGIIEVPSGYKLVSLLDL